MVTVVVEDTDKVVDTPRVTTNKVMARAINEYIVYCTQVSCISYFHLSNE